MREPIMREIDSGVNIDSCPYWELEKNEECGISKGGIYIPLPGHVKMFCLSSKYSQCQQYINCVEMFTDQEISSRRDFEDIEDRRRLKRYLEQIYFDITVCDRNIGPQVMNSYKAKSLDVSLGGMRIETPRKFNTDTVVSFALDPDFSSDYLLGVGEVKWCMPQKDSKRFESGIAFSNYSTSEKVKQYLHL